MRSVIGAVFVSSFAVACASSPTPPAGSATTVLYSAEDVQRSELPRVSPACTGKQFDADDPDPRCLRHRAGEAAPDPKALAVTVHADSIAKSGHETDLVVEMRNASGKPLTLDVDPACSFEPTATDGTNQSFETDCGGICGSTGEPNVLHVTLDPDGVVVKRVRFFATQTRVVVGPHGDCEEHAVGALPPGRYKVTVSLPWAYPSSEAPGRLDARMVDVPLTITP